MSTVDRCVRPVGVLAHASAAPRWQTAEPRWRRAGRCRGTPARGVRGWHEPRARRAAALPRVFTLAARPAAPQAAYQRHPQLQPRQQPCHRISQAADAHRRPQRLRQDGARHAAAARAGPSPRRTRSRWRGAERARRAAVRQTIIECLKHAVTGEWPPNSHAGKSFVHDPKARFARHARPSCAAAGAPLTRRGGRAGCRRD
jgi:hypothetical protein